MKKIKILTQNNCSKCIALKSYLEMGLRNRYAEDIEYVKREDDPEGFMEYVQQFDIMATPAIICDNAVLKDTAPSKVNTFLSENLG